MHRKLWAYALLAWLAGSAGCATRHEVEVKPMEVKPIHITIDVNVKVDRALDNFFDEIDSTRQKLKEAQAPGKP